MELGPQAISGTELPIVRLLDIPVNRVLEWTLGPGLDNSIVGLGLKGLGSLSALKGPCGLGH